MGSEGYAGAVSFVNTRLRAGLRAYDESFATGINAEFVPFSVRLRHADGRTRSQPLMALVGLDNLYGDHNPTGMVTVNYGGPYLNAIPVKPEPDDQP